MANDSASSGALIPSTTSVFNSKDPKSPVLSLNMANATKLTTTNYIVWSQQIQFLFEGYELQTLISPDVEVPSAIVTENGLTKPNPLKTHWKRQDRLLHSSLLSAISNSMQSLVSCATSCLNVWSTLERTYGHPTRGHIKQLKNQLKHAQKGSKSIDEYMRGIRGKSNQLALLGKPLDHI